MNKGFINKIRQIILEHLEDENFGVTELAFELGLSSSQLLRKVKIFTGKPVNHLIRKIRLNQALELIKEGDFSSAEISYKVGFSSPSYFCKCFHEHFGYTPGEFKSKNEKSFVDDKTDRNPDRPGIIKFQRYLVLGISILAIIIISYLLIDNSNVQRVNTQALSIAVLPFKNLSGDKSNQYFADGVMDVILSHLSSIEDFNVVSRTTMEQYRETAKTAPEIAEELNISYILEASVQKHADKVRIVIQLIDAKNDRHIWSDDFESNYEDIFGLQSDIAIQVATALERNLSPSELERIENKPTTNIEAFNLYLKGRFFWHRRTEEDLKKSVLYFEQAIALDSTYALAYAGLADAYFIMTWWEWYSINDGFKKGEEYAIKALSINANIPEAHATLGGIATYFEWNREKAEKELKLAISLNPSYATAHQYYAELLDILEKNKEAREQINLAIKFNPNSPIMYSVSSIIYYNNSEFEKAINAAKKSLEFTNKKSLINIFKSYVKLGMNEKAVEHLKLIIPNNLNNNYSLIDKVYKESGIEGIIYWYIDWKLFHKQENNYQIASLYSIVGDTQKALDYLEKCYEKDYPVLARMNSNIDFNILRNEPRFESLLKKLNLK